MSATTKLPTPSGSVGTWGAELNDFLTQSMVGSTTGDVTNGLLKIDHAAITTGGKVGIGTSSPATILDVASQGVGVTTSTLRGQTVLIGSNPSIFSIFNGGTDENTYIRGGKSNSDVIINDLSIGRTSINQNGGTASFGKTVTGENGSIYPLSVYGNNGINWSAGAGELAFGGVLNVGSIDGGGSLTVRTPSLSTVYPSGFGIDGSYDAVSLQSTINLKAFGVWSGGSYGSVMAFHTTAAKILSEKMRIISNGNVGINTTSPTSKLHVVGIPVHANDESAGIAGLTTGAFYQNSTGALFVKQ